MRALLSIALVLLATCHRDASPACPDPAAAVPVAKPVVHVAAEDQDLRMLLAEVAASRACALIRGQYRPLRDLARPGVVTGTMWIRGCKITQHGRDVSFHLTGQGWQWADQKQQKAGATFSVEQYVRFDIDATILGALDVAYASKQHVVSLWFSPNATPDVKFTPIGELDVDAEGAWSTVLGALGTLVAHSPEELAGDAAAAQGSKEFKKQFADGVSVTIDLCTGLPRFGLGRPAQGVMVAPDAGETRKVPVELQPGAVIAFGPYLAPHGMTIRVHAHTGAVKIEAACQDDAAALTASYTATGKSAFDLQRLAGKDVRGTATIEVKHTSCPVVVVARTIGSAPATFDWTRPEAEAANATGGSIVDCD